MASSKYSLLACVVLSPQKPHNGHEPQCRRGTHRTGLAKALKEHQRSCALPSGEDGGGSRGRGGVNLAGVAPGLLGLAVALLAEAVGGLLARLADVAGVAQGAERDDEHEDDAEGGAADEDPAEALNVGL